MIALLIGAVFGAAVTAGLLRLIERYAEALGLMDIPNARSSHSRPTARGGGVAIVVGVGVGAAATLVAMEAEIPVSAWAFLAAAGAVAAVSLLDDVRSLPPAIRLMAQAGAALFALGWIAPVQVVELPLAGRVVLGAVGPFCMLVWIVAVTNIFNFMDGIDGIAGGQAVVAGLGWGVAATVAGTPFVVAAGFAIAAASAMFLLRNWEPARVFMGDVGSAFLGFAFGVLPFLATPGGIGARAWTLGALLLWPFLVDSTITLVRRLARGENVTRAHREHLYQRLVVLGASHAQVALLYLGLAAAMAGPAIAWALGWLPGSLAAAPALLIALALPVEVGRRERQHHV